MAERCRMYEVWWLMWNIISNFANEIKAANNELISKALAIGLQELKDKGEI